MRRPRLSLPRVRAALAGRARAAWHRAVRRGGGVVLLYHRIAELPSDPLSLAVHPRRFEEHLEVVRAVGYPMRLDEMMRRTADGTLPRRAVAVTIDDGYADALLGAFPLLERHAVPATCFVTTGPVRSAGELWWDTLDRALLRAGTLPSLLSLRTLEVRYDCGLDGAAEYSEADAARHRGWSLVAGADPTARHRAFRELHELCYGLRAEAREAVLSELRRVAALDRRATPDRRFLSPSEVAVLAASGLVEVGAHSVNHPALDRLSAAQQRVEILGSRRHLEEATGRAVPGFSYPHGRFDAATLEILRRARFSYGAAADSGAVWRGTDPMRVPRLYVPDEDGDALARRLRRWLA
jgi:peptidoglycan/xylan/chitin deacetylase (PgdA/CDA1 family)